MTTPKIFLSFEASSHTHHTSSKHTAAPSVPSLHLPRIYYREISDQLLEESFNQMNINQLSCDQLIWPETQQTLTLFGVLPPPTACVCSERNVWGGVMSACPHAHQSGMSDVRAHCIISHQPLLLSLEAQTGSKSGSNSVLVDLCWSGRVLNH